MKKMIFSVLMVMGALVAFAQDKPADDGQMRQKLFDAKMREMVYRLEITDAQKPEFEKVYREYDSEIHALLEKCGPNFHKKKADKELRDKEKSAADVAAVMKQRLDAQKMVLEVRSSYIDHFAKVLDGKQLRKFFDVEKNMQDKLRKGRRGGHDRAGNGGPRGNRGGKRGFKGDRSDRGDFNR